MTRAPRAPPATTHPTLHKLMHEIVRESVPDCHLILWSPMRVPSIINGPSGFLFGLVAFTLDFLHAFILIHERCWREPCILNLLSLLRDEGHEPLVFCLETSILLLKRYGDGRGPGVYRHGGGGFPDFAKERNQVYMLSSVGGRGRGRLPADCRKETKDTTHPPISPLDNLSRSSASVLFTTSSPYSPSALLLRPRALLQLLSPPLPACRACPRPCPLVRKGRWGRPALLRVPVAEGWGGLGGQHR